MTAGARLFGPPAASDGYGQPGRIEPAGVTAALIALGAKMAKSDGLVTPDEVAALALYLVSDEAKFITGTDFPIDGGFIKLNT